MRTSVSFRAESLQPRTLLANILGTAAADTIDVRIQGSDIVATVNGVQTNYPDASETVIVIDALGANDTITIQSTGANAVTINSGEGNDTITVGGTNWATNVTGDVLVDGGAGTDLLIADDTAFGSSGSSFAVTSNSLRKGFGPFMTFATTEQFRLAASAFADTVSVADTAVGVNYNFLLGNGADQLNIGNGAGPNIAGPLVVNSGNGTDTLRVGAGDLDEITAYINLNVMAGPPPNADAVIINDSLDTSPSITYAFNDFQFFRNGGTAGFPGVGIFSEGSILLQCNGLDNTINFYDSEDGDSLVNPTIEGNGGNDIFNINETGPAVGNRVTFRGGAGNDQLNINADGVGFASARTDRSDYYSAVRVGTNGELRLNWDLHTVLDMGSYEGSLGTFFVNNNHAIIRQPSNAAAIESALRTGYNLGGWNGTGPGSIKSDTAAQSSISDGVGFAHVGNGAGQLAIAAFRGNAVNQGDMLLSYALNGDSDLDGDVDFSDLLTLAQNYGGNGLGWHNGNFNYDSVGSVSFDDLLSLAQNYGNTLLNDGRTFQEKRSALSFNRGIGAIDL